jgi:CBS domain-containing protein
MIWAVALGSGTSGGVLAPLLMIGAGLGSVLAPWLPGGSPQLWALVCMSAVLGGTMRAPMMAVVFAFGLTHDVNAFLPTILGCTVAYGFSVIVMPRSILTEKLARRGRHVFREYGVDPLERHFVEEVMTPNVMTIPGSELTRDVWSTYFGSKQQHRAYPVVEDGRLLGVLDRSVLNGLPPAALEEPVARVFSAYGRTSGFTTPGETCRAAALKMAAEGLERLAVIDAPATRRVVGMLTRSDLLKPSSVIHEEDFRRERLLAGPSAGP